jgi:hypothetical protein
LFLPQRTRLVFGRDGCIGVESSHVNGLSATFPGAAGFYDFDPTTWLENSGKTPVNNKLANGFRGLSPVGRSAF